MKITFIKGHTALRKTITPEGAMAYPRVKNLTSNVVELPADDLEQRVEVYKQAAAAGKAMMKGPFKRPLVKESRAGQTDKQARTHILMLDVDDIVVDPAWVQAPLNRTMIERLAEHIVGELPECFRSISYICHASSSLGLKVGAMSLHLEFTLEQAIDPKELKRYLKHLNLRSEFFLDKMRLTGAGDSSTWPLDLCLADNTRVIYIAEPEFVDLVDPIPNLDDRVFVVRKQQVLLDLVREWALCPNDNVLKRQARAHVKLLREDSGLVKTKTFKTHDITVDGNVTPVITNPDTNLRLTPLREYDDYVAYQLSGDGWSSNAYFVRKKEPMIVRSWKQEQPFLFDKASRSDYELHLSTYNYGTPTKIDSEGSRISLNEGATPIVFRDVVSNTFYNGLYNAAYDKFIYLKKTSRLNIEDYMINHGSFEPEVIPQYNLEFDPSDSVVMNIPARKVNRFSLPLHLAQPPLIPSELVGLPGESLLATMKEHCPSTTALLIHALAGEDETEYFLNWLAAIFQCRKKTGSAWVLSGVHGTGKGIVWKGIIEPILTELYVHYMKTNDLGEKFNGWLAETLMVGVDEFEIRPSNQDSGVTVWDKLKTYITEPMCTIRKMNNDQVTLPTFANFIFFSNKVTPVRITETERRLNIAPYQKLTLYQKYDEDIANRMIDEDIPAERNRLIGILMRCIVHERNARVPMNNQAKRDAQRRSEDSGEKFFHHFRDGDLEHFTRTMIRTPDLNEFSAAARNLFTSWLTSASRGEPCVIFSDELRTMYCALVNPKNPIPLDKFDKLLVHKEMEPSRVRRQLDSRQGWVITWSAEPERLEEMVTTYLHDLASKETSVAHIPCFGTT